jgi:hypothetical protein
MKEFSHELGEQVELESGEKGVTIARAEYLESEPSYLIRYVAADQRLTESWWSGRAIKEKLQAAA